MSNDYHLTVGQHVDDEPNNYKQTHLILDPSISIILRVNADNKNLSKHEQCSSLLYRWGIDMWMIARLTSMLITAINKMKQQVKLFMSSPSSNNITFPSYLMFHRNCPTFVGQCTAIYKTVNFSIISAALTSLPAVQNIFCRN